jgi:hypothetical protein
MSASTCWIAETAPAPAAPVRSCRSSEITCRRARVSLARAPAPSRGRRAHHASEGGLGGGEDTHGLADGGASGDHVVHQQAALAGDLRADDDAALAVILRLLPVVREVHVLQPAR